VLGVTAKAIDVVVETGDAGPLTAIGINLPNDQAIREQYGSKSVTLSNVSEAYEQSTPEAMRDGFSWSPEEAARARRWGAFSQELATELHEVIGHGSGRMAEGITASPHHLLKECFSAIEESRADLVALYFIADAKLVDLGLIDAASQDDIVRAEYEYYARNALLQLRRVRQGTQIEEDHMRNRHLIVSWLMAHTAAIERRARDGKTFFVMTDAQAFREGAGRLLAEVQRIKSEGDYQGARALVDCYGVHFDPLLRDEIVRRVEALQLPSYSAFVMPRLEAVHGAGGEIVDVAISYPCDLEAQMLEYAALTQDDLQATSPQ
jgi:dipeptidyl-peptidase III